jgi:periplasmic divalent cation tolerance protein
MASVILLYTTWPDQEKARAAARAAVEARLAACANILAPMQSLYRWEGEIECAGETPMLLKTTAEAAPALRSLILELHPYELPCVLALPANVEFSDPDYVAWIARETLPQVS